MPRVDSRSQARGYSGARRALSLATAAVFLNVSCAVRDHRPVPLTDPSLVTEKLLHRRVHVLTKTGWLVIDVASVSHPFVEGRAWPGPGEVRFDLRNAKAAVEIPEPGVRRNLIGDPTQRDHTGKRVRFTTGSGPVALRVTSQTDTHLWGQPLTCAEVSWNQEVCPGLISVDLREVSRIETRAVKRVRTVAGTLGAIVLLWVAAALVYIKTCPEGYTCEH